MWVSTLLCIYNDRMFEQNFVNWNVNGITQLLYIAFGHFNLIHHWCFLPLRSVTCFDRASHPPMSWFLSKSSFPGLLWLFLVSPSCPQIHILLHSNLNFVFFLIPYLPVSNSIVYFCQDLQVAHWDEILLNFWS